VATDITMPRLSDSMEEGTIARWLVEVGQEVARGQVLAEIDTDKATMEYEAEAAGTILELVVPEGETAPIGAPIARIGAAGETVSAPRPAEPAASRTRPDEAPAPIRPPASGPSSAAAAGSRGRVNASPIARRLAADLGVDLASIAGSGPGGQITKEDVQRAAGPHADGAPTPSPASEVTLVEPTRVQQVIARRMAEGAAVPTFAVEAEIDMTAVVSHRAGLGGGDGPQPSLNDYVVKAAALALREFPRVNGSYTERGFELHGRVNVGIAVATEDSLLVPVVPEADAKPLTAIATEARALAVKVRDGTIAAPELDGGTFTITNLGMFGSSRFLPILNPPQAAILALGAVSSRPVYDDQGALAARSLMNATLVCDHRIVYGAEAARFLARLGELLARPAELG
jgi:pyruvate dehydrogenase E2 component (dihydrolipoamide acetyltransferase)